MISKSVVTEEVVDIYQTLGIENPDISILSDDFLKDVEGLQQKNVAVELLNKLLKGQVKSLMKTNATVSKRFSEMLSKSIQKYNNRSIEASKVIEELIQMAKEIKQEQKRGNDLGLSTEEIAFYDALASHETAKEAMGDKELRAIAHELTKTVKDNMSVDWSKRDSAKAKMRVQVRRLLKKYGLSTRSSENSSRTSSRTSRINGKSAIKIYNNAVRERIYFSNRIYYNSILVYILDT